MKAFGDKQENPGNPSRAACGEEGGVPAKYGKKYKFLIRFLARVAVTAGIIAALFLWVFRLYRMDGNAMFPAVRDGDLCILYRLDSYHPDDVVLYEDVAGRKHLGRIAAVPGQTVDFPENGNFTVDGYLPFSEIPYDTERVEDAEVEYPLTLSDEEYFILNDYREAGSDSRTYGAVREQDFQGKLIFLLRRRGF